MEGQVTLWLCFHDQSLLLLPIEDLCPSLAYERVTLDLAESGNSCPLQGGTLEWHWDSEGQTAAAKLCSGSWGGLHPRDRGKKDRRQTKVGFPELFHYYSEWLRRNGSKILTRTFDCLTLLCVFWVSFSYSLITWSRQPRKRSRRVTFGNAWPPTLLTSRHRWKSNDWTYHDGCRERKELNDCSTIYIAPSFQFNKTLCKEFQNKIWFLNIEKKLLNKVIICACFVHKRYSRSFIRLRLSPWCHMDYFNDVLLRFWALNVSVALRSMEGQKALGLQQNIFMCSEAERRSYGFGTTWRWVINDRIFRIFIFGWNIPLKHKTAILNCSNILHYCFLLYFWLNKYSLGEHKIIIFFKSYWHQTSERWCSIFVYLLLNGSL